MNQREPLILGIESSCDETAAAVVAGGRRILSSVIASQVAIHRKYGGVVPELASREHLRRIVPVVREALEQAGIALADLDAIAVTRGPGLIGALLVGVTYGKVLALALGKPLVAVNHLEGHVHAVLLEAHAASRRPQLPAVCLIVSGGHTILYRVESVPACAHSTNDSRQGTPELVPSGAEGAVPQDFSASSRQGAAELVPSLAEGAVPQGFPVASRQGTTLVVPKPALPPGASAPEANGNAAARFRYTRIGGTRDDAAGEAYDKVARMLALGYPGGPIIDQLAPHGNPRAIRFAEPKMRGNPFDFSFSGIKTAVLYHLRRNPQLQPEIEARQQALARGDRSAETLRQLSTPATLDLIASFQRAVVENLVARTLAAAQDGAGATAAAADGFAQGQAAAPDFDAPAPAAADRPSDAARATTKSSAAQDGEAPDFAGRIADQAKAAAEAASAALRDLAFAPTPAGHVGAPEPAALAAADASAPDAAPRDAARESAGLAAAATRTVLVSGGVAANRELRAAFEAEATRRGIEVFFPSRALSTDNAAMIAAAAHPRLLAGLLEDATLNAEANLRLE